MADIFDVLGASGKGCDDPAELHLSFGQPRGFQRNAEALAGRSDCDKASVESRPMGD